MPLTSPIGYLAGYPAELAAQAQALIAAGQMGDILRRKYPHAHTVRTDKALYDHVHGLKSEHMRNAAQLSRVAFDGKLQTLRKALGTHTRISRVQGGKLKTKREIHIASAFRHMPLEFLHMIVVHELAHLKEPEHDKAFYQLCRHMEPNYHQLEFDLRVYLTYLEAGGEALW